MSNRLTSKRAAAAIKLISAIAATELMIMVLFSATGIDRMLSKGMVNLADTLLLSLAASVMIYYWIVKPMKTADEYRRVEDRLRESEINYRLLFENNPTPMWAYDTETLAFLAVNDAAVSCYGYTKEELLGMTIEQIRPAEEIPRLHDQLERFSEGSDAAVFRHRKKNGDLIDVEITSKRTVLNGRSAKIVLAHDISERRKNEERIRQSEKRYRALFEGSKDAIYLTRRDGPFLDVNQSALDLFGYLRDEMLGMDVRNIYMNPDDRPLFQREIEKNGFIRDYEIQFRKKNGTVMDCLLTSTLITDEAGVIVGYQGIIRDVTERKKMEDQLFQSKQDWEDTFNTITDMITVHDRDFNIIRANRAAEGILGLPFLNKSTVKCYEYYHGIGCPPEGCPSCQVLKTAVASTSVMFEPHLNKNIEIRAIPRLDKNQQLIGLIHVVRDVTEQKRLEEQLRQAQKMEAVGQLAGGIAHDFNNILTAIIGYSHLLQMKMPEGDPMRSNVAHILDASERAASLTSSLLAFSRKQIMNMKLIDLNPLVSKLEKLLRRLIREDIELKTLFSDNKVNVMADSGQIEQVLMNLVANARDAMPNGGRLTISVEQVHIGDEFIKLDGRGRPGEYALISVSDTGSGMDEKTRLKIFEPFFTTKEQGKGTGLGLSMVYGIVKQHEGYITAESEPGSGTVFRIYLPSVSPQDEGEEETSAAPAAEIRGGTENILVAEDDAALRKLAMTMLQQFGYTVIEASDGEEAVSKFSLNRDNISLVMMDAIMPNKNGKEAYDEMKILKSDIKVLFMSGYASDVISSAGISDKDVYFVQKPLSPMDMLKKVREILDS